MKLVECVPNFSEGRDKDKIQSIVDEIETVPMIKLLDVDPGESTNRTVVTFIGPPEAVAEAAFRAIAKAADVIDMRTHQGAHSRIFFVSMSCRLRVDAGLHRGSGQAGIPASSPAVRRISLARRPSCLSWFDLRR